MGKTTIDDKVIFKLKYRYENGGGTVRELARLFGLSKSQVHNVITGKQRKKIGHRRADE